MRRCGIIILVFLPFLGFSRTQELNDLLSCYLQPAPAAEASFHSFLKDIEKNTFKNDKAFLHHIFKRIHKTYLKKYEAYSQFPDLFSSGKYDCLTATVLFSLVLSEFDFQYSLIETNYHIFLVVHTSQGDVLLETTDRLNGFITEPHNIEERMGIYRLNLIASNFKHDHAIYHYQHDLYHEIRPAQLQGLLYYNQAVKAYNSGEFNLCADLLDQAKTIYDSPRIEEMAFLLIQSVNANEADASKKLKIVTRLREYLVAKSLAGL